MNITPQLNIDNAKSYATEERLMKVLDTIVPAEVIRRCVVVCNRRGRFTAVIPASACDGSLGRYASQGFMTIG